jgi:hypothetical protein
VVEEGPLPAERPLEQILLVGLVVEEVDRLLGGVGLEEGASLGAEFRFLG